MTYFQKTNASNLPQRHPTVVFTEPKVYHLLRVLTDETLRMSYTTIRRPVLNAAGGKLTTAPSRTDHFREKTRDSTLCGCAESESSDAETAVLPTAESEDQETTGYGEFGDSSSFPGGESDSAAEMALISASFRTVGKSSSTGSVPMTAQADDMQKEIRKLTEVDRTFS